MRKTVMVVALLAAPTWAFADSATVPGGFGSQTNVWMLMQQLPGYTDNDVRPIPGEVASHTYNRYVKSFSYPIPETFKREGSGSSGGGSGSSSSSSGSTTGSAGSAGY